MGVLFKGNQLVFMYMWLWWSTCICVDLASDSLHQGDTPLNCTTVLYSKNGNYSLSFSKTNPQNLANLVIRSTKYDFLVWIANRNQPVDLDSAVLSLNHSGVLKIESQNVKPIILYSPPQNTNNTGHVRDPTLTSNMIKIEYISEAQLSPHGLGPNPKSNNIVATLLDTGNFVLQQLHPNGTKTLLWQSFDYPAEVLVPGMKLGVNHRTGHKWSLISRLTDPIRTPGAFKLEWEPTRGELIIKRREKVCWQSGKLRNNNRFEHIPKEVQSFYNYTILSNGDENSFILTTLNGKFTHWMLLETGQLSSNEGDIARADMCYGYNTDGGCQRWEAISTCRQFGDVFEKRMGNPNYDYVLNEPNVSYGCSDCRASCWSNCNCTGFKSLYINGTGCIFFLFNSSMQGVALDSTQAIFYMLVKKTRHNGTKKWIWRIVVIATALLIISPFILCIATKKRKIMLEEKKRKRTETEMLDLAASNESLGIKDLEEDLKLFSYASVVAATNDFSSENKLGQGGFGPVYKGVLPTGEEVAIKRLSKGSAQGIVEFRNELTLISELQHMNLVQLIGCCIHEEERILMYEYMPNKSLDLYIFDSTRKMLLDWKKRFNIIEGISQGLLYLHKYSRIKIIHRDLKASNILLDENMNPKISDFGMARMFTQQEFSANTNRIVGTYGYMSPEYAMEGIFSTKSDVYSFGVLMLEIVSGRRNTCLYDSDRLLNLIGHAWELWNKGVSLQLLDPSLNESFDPDEVQRCINVGLLCVEQYPNDRPTMSDVISMLTNKSVAYTLPRRPAFYVGKEIIEENLSYKEFNTCSTKEMSTFSKV